MKKTLIAVAALAATASFAQVTIYGLVDIGYGTHNTTSRNSAVFTKSSGVMDGANAGNRIGFRGTEDLGGGLSADFLIEQGISPTNGALFGVRSGAAGHQYDGFSASGSAAAASGTAGAYSQGTNRQSFLGVKGGMGTVRIGYQYTNLYELSTLAGFVQGSEGTPGADKAHTHGNAAVGGTRANGLTYISPTMNGVTVQVQTGAFTGREDVTSNTAITASGLSVDKNNRMGIMVKYASGPVALAFAHTKADMQASVIASGLATRTNVYGALIAAATSATTNAAERSASLNQVGGSYTMGAAKVGFTYNKGDNGGSTTSTVATDYKAYNISASYALGAYSPFVSMGRADSKLSSTGALSEDYKLAQAGVRYNLSKRSVAYVMHGITQNNAVSADTTAGFKDQKTIIGLSHSF